jgi:hypothetical protein
LPLRLPDDDHYQLFGDYIANFRERCEGNICRYVF